MYGNVKLKNSKTSISISMQQITVEILMINVAGTVLCTSYPYFLRIYNLYSVTGIYLYKYYVYLPRLPQ